jgi:hypothetical protein
VAVGLAAAALPVGLASAAGHMTRAELAVPGELLSLVTPTAHRPAPAPAHGASVPRHPSAFASPVAARARRATLGDESSPSVGAAVAAEPAPARARVAPAADPPGVALAQPTLQPRPPEERPARIGSPGHVSLPAAPVSAPGSLPVSSTPVPAALPADPPVAEAATAAPPESVAPSVAPTPAAPSAPSSPAAPGPHREESSSSPRGE